MYMYRFLHSNNKSGLQKKLILFAGFETQQMVKMVE